MSFEYNYKCDRTHARGIQIELENGMIQKVVFDGGCNGNTKGIERLVAGMKATDVIERLSGTPCRHFPGTSCPDQLARGLKAALEAEKRQLEDAGS
ncbi:MAG: TIGR03905 family TSCPD domain-containing protein [Bacillota bacterium]|nr:TIGR03905 family TSCPD domain-containing protein [Bacillota bacterium]